MKLELEPKPWVPISGEVTIWDREVAVTIGNTIFVPRDGRGTVRLPEVKTPWGEKPSLRENPFS